MVNKKSLVMGLVVILSLVLLTSLVSATSTVKAPATSTLHGGTIDVNCLIASEPTITNSSNVTIIYSIAGGTNYTILLSNTSLSDTNFSKLAVDISSRTESASYIFTCVAVNTTEGTEVYSAAITSVTLDSTNPSVAVTRHGLYYVEQQAFSQVECVYSDGVDTSLTVTRSLVKPSGDTVTTTEDLHTYAASDFDELGDYTYTCTATDDLSNTNSDTTTFKVVSVESAGSTQKAVIKASALLGGGNNTAVIAAGIVIFILILAIGGGVVTSKGKKRKRK